MSDTAEATDRRQPVEAPGAFRVLRSGGRFEYYRRGANPDAQACAGALRAAGFRDVRVVSDVLVTATEP
jgi:hypothetical protein